MSSLAYLRTIMPRYAYCTLLFVMLPAIARTESPAAKDAAKTSIVFSRDILGILSENCFQCHGPDEKTRRAKLRLDTRAGMLKVVVPGKPPESALHQRITATLPTEV